VAAVSKRLSKSFQNPQDFAAPGLDGASHNFLDIFCAVHYIPVTLGSRDLPAGRFIFISLGKGLFYGQG